MKNKINEYRKDFKQLKEAKLKELNKASIKIINITAIIEDLLKYGATLNALTLNRLYYHLREDYIEAITERKNVERQTIKGN